MEVRFYLTGQDVWNFQKSTMLRRQSLVPLGILLGVLLFLLFLLTGWNNQAPSFFAALISSVLMPTLSLFVVLFLLYLVLMWSARTRTSRYLLLQGEHIVALGPEGFWYRNNFTDSLIYWRAIKEIRVDQHNLCLFLQSSRATAHIIPRRAFATPQDAETFLHQARFFWSSAHSAPPLPPAALPPTSERWG